MRNAIVFCLVVLLSSSFASGADGQVQEKKGPTELSLATGGGPAQVVYRYGDVPKKSYVSQLRTPAGVQLLRDAPHDHLHHHGLMFAVAVDGVDFWSENAACGSQVDRTASRSGASLAAQLDWLAPDQRLLAKESRTISLQSAATLGANLVTWRTQLSPPPGKDSIRLSGSHYFGLGMRFVESMDKGGRHFNSAGREGAVVRGSEQLVPAAWTAYWAEADGKPVTVALFDHPRNPRPATMFTMTVPFAYLSATLNLAKEPLEVKAAGPLSVCYGVAAIDGHPDSAAVEKLYQQWISLANNPSK